MWIQETLPPWADKMIWRSSGETSPRGVLRKKEPLVALFMQISSLLRRAKMLSNNTAIVFFRSAKYTSHYYPERRQTQYLQVCKIHITLLPRTSPNSISSGLQSAYHITIQNVAKLNIFRSAKYTSRYYPELRQTPYLQVCTTHITTIQNVAKLHIFRSAQHTSQPSRTLPNSISSGLQNAHHNHPEIFPNYMIGRQIDNWFLNTAGKDGRLILLTSMLAEVILLIYYYYYYYDIDRRIYLNLSKSTQSTARLKASKPAANGSYLMCKSLPYNFHLLYRSAFILLSAKCILGLFLFP